MCRRPGFKLPPRAVGWQLRTELGDVDRFEARVALPGKCVWAMVRVRRETRRSNGDPAVAGLRGGAGRVKLQLEYLQLRFTASLAASSARRGPGRAAEACRRPGAAFGVAQLDRTVSSRRCRRARGRVRHRQRLRPGLQEPRAVQGGRGALGGSEGLTARGASCEFRLMRAPAASPLVLGGGVRGRRRGDLQIERESARTRPAGRRRSSRPGSEAANSRWPSSLSAVRRRGGAKCSRRNTPWAMDRRADVVDHDRLGRYGRVSRSSFTASVADRSDRQIEGARHRRRLARLRLVGPPDASGTSMVAALSSGIETCRCSNAGNDQRASMPVPFNPRAVAALPFESPPIENRTPRYRLPLAPSRRSGCRRRSNACCALATTKCSGPGADQSPPATTMPDSSISVASCDEQSAPHQSCTRSRSGSGSATRWP